MIKNNDNLKRYQIQAWSVVLFGFFGFIIWAALYPMEQGVSGTGYVVSQSEKIIITSPVNGLVKKLYKKAGDKVAEGELIIDFDKSVIEHSLKATQQGLIGVQASNLSLTKAYAAKVSQIQAIEKQYQANKKLTEAGFLSQYALSSIQNQLSLAESESLQIKAQINQGDSKFQELREQLSGISQQMTLQKVSSPVSGSLMNLNITSSGVSVSQGQVLMEIVPEGKDYRIDAKLPVEFADKLHVGMDVDVMFPTLSGSNTIRVTGKVQYISADKIIDVRSNQVYLESKITINNNSDSQLSAVKVGLPVMVVLNTGQRTMLSYITRPFIDRLSMGLK